MRGSSYYADRYSFSVEAGALNGLSQSAQQTLSAQMALQTATQQLRESDFTQTLAGFRALLA